MRIFLPTAVCLCAAGVPAGIAAEPAEDEALYVRLADDAGHVLARILRLARAGKWAEAVAEAQKPLAARDAGLFEVEPRVYVPFAERVRRELLTWPAAGVRAYRERFERTAARLFREARDARSIGGLAEAAYRYPLCTAASRALAALAEIHIQRGELHEAARALDALLRRKPIVRLDWKALEAKRAALAAALRKRPDRPPEGNGEWRTLGGEAARTSCSARTFRIGFRRWSFDVPEADVDGGVASGLQSRGRRVPRILHPAVSGRRVFVQTTRWVAALDRESGEVLWRTPRRPDRPSSRSCRDAVLAPAVERGRVFAFVGGQLVALSASSGARIWALRNLVGRKEKPAAAAKGDGGKPALHVLVNAPVVADGKVFVLAALLRQETEAVAVAADARTGAVRWRAKLCSQVFRGRLGRGSHPAPPAWSEGVVYVSTNLGAVAALDGETGEVRWLARYDAFTPARRRAALRDDACWENGPPAVYRDLVLVAPQDADHLIAFDRATGRLRWRVPRLGMRYFVGVAAGRAYLSGDRAAAVDVKTGKVVWLSGRLGRAAGRPALTRSALWIPTASALIRLDAHTGQPTLRYRLDDPRECGNLVMTGGALFSASFDRVDRYDDASRIRGASARDHLRLGRRLDRLGRPDAAVQQYQLALSALDKEGEKAAQALRADVRGAMVAAHRRRAETLAAAGKLAEAERAFQRAVRYAPTPGRAVETALALGRCYERQIRWAKAVAHYRALMRDRRGVPFEIRPGVVLPADAVAEARVRRILRSHPDAEPTARTPARRAAPKDEAFLPAWRTAYDTTRSAAVVLAGGGAPRVDGERVLAFATKDLGDRRTFLWDAVECRRASDGRLLWRTRIGPCLPRAHCSGGKIIVRAVSHFVALDLRTGAVAWTTRRASPKKKDGLLGLGRGAEARRIVESAAGGGRVFAATASGDVFALDLKTGAEAWRKKVAEPVLAGSMALAAGKLVLCGESPGVVRRFDPANGAEAAPIRIRRRDNRLTDPPAWQVRNGRLCLVVGDRQVRNLRLDTGGTLWAVEMPFSVGRVAATPDETRVVVFPDRWSFGGKVTCLDAATGRELWKQPAQGRRPDAAFVGSDLLVSLRRGRVVDTLVAQRTKDGSVAWRRPLRVKFVIDTLVGAGQFVIASGSGLDFDGWRGWAVVLRKRDGAVVRTLARGGSGHTSAAWAADTFLFSSGRGIEAYRVQDRRAAAVRLAELLEGTSGPADDAAAAEAARLLFARGAFEPAMRRLERPLLAEAPKPESFGHLHAPLMAVREAAAEQGRTTYEAPRFRTPPTIDGRLCEDWRADRAAVLDTPRHVERIQRDLPPHRFWFGPNDLSATLYVGWDDQHLYLAVDVNDDVQRTHDFDADDWEGDCLMVAIDPEGDGGYRLRGGDNVFWLALAAKPRRPRDDRARLGGEHSIKIKEDESGTVYELALPWSEIGVERPRAGLRLGLNILVIDDDGARPLKAVSWTPGLTQNRNRDVMSSGIAPALFGTVILKER